ncbi:MAG TPA: ABC transporter ATP-binding protein [Methanolinea sp.]|nr:ABC transporter ATP-binding protein [Methanolinea sp.]
MIAISVKNLGKMYNIGLKEPYHTIGDIFSRKFSNIFNCQLNSSTLFNEKEFWALKDISFEIYQGEIVGIIGKNGAGKSTLLKILSRITTPTEGFVEIKGRIGSLLEVGTGFHPELTGRENIYLNGAILGMKKSDIESKFEDIVKFSDIEKFLDIPVKRYSSGMYVRLAFAVAAHLDTDILLIDEILAVGDSRFQKKCLGKMSELVKESKTVLFVSHNMNAVEQLCNKCIFLDKGRIIYNSSNVKNIINKYLFYEDFKMDNFQWINSNNEFENPFFKPYKFFIGHSNGQKIENPISNCEDIWVFIEGTIEKIDPALQIGYAIFNEDGILLYWSCFTDNNETEWIKLSKGKVILKTKIPKRFLNQGSYRIEMIVALYFKEWICQPGINAPAIHLNIQGGLSDSPYWLHKRPGVLAPIMEWNLFENFHDENVLP